MNPSTNEITKEALCQMAIDAMKKAYVPYSGYRVGAALLDEAGHVTCGCNIENASYTPTVCAERTAFFKAISSRELPEEACSGGEENNLPHFVRIAVAGGKGGVIGGAFPPCGVCRQVMSEFCDDQFEILVVQSADPLRYDTYTLPQLLPLRFSPEYLEK